MAIAGLGTIAIYLNPVYAQMRMVVPRLSLTSSSKGIQLRSQGKKLVRTVANVFASITFSEPRKQKSGWAIAF